MMPAWLITLAPVVGIIVNVVLQVVLVHTTRLIGLSIVGGVLGGLLAALAEATLNLPRGGSLMEAIAVWVFAIISYLGFCYPYWVFVNLNITSLRIRTLRDLMHHAGGISLSSMMAQYSLDEMLQRRLERLEHGDQITCTDGLWRLKKGKVLLLLHHTLALLRFIIFPASARSVDLSDAGQR